MVSLLPFWIAHVLATRELVPSHHRGELLIATLVIGPVLWASASWVNDACDLDGDRINPRKADSPLVRGVLSERAVWRGAILSALVAVALAFAVNVAFALVVLGALSLAWVLSCAGAVLLAALDVLVPRHMLWVFAVTIPLLVWEFHVLIGRARDPDGIVRGIVVCSLTFLASNSLFALMYTGVWDT